MVNFTLFRLLFQIFLVSLHRLCHKCSLQGFLYLCTGYVTNAVYRVPDHGAPHREVDATVRQVGG